MNDSKVKKTKEEWQEQLSSEQYQVTRCADTERAFSGPYWDTKERGIYHCICCDSALFNAAAKFDSGTGWPSFFQPIDKGSVGEVFDDTHGMRRTEVICQSCDAHLGHIFPDGPQPTGLRYCLNGTALKLKPEQE